VERERQRAASKNGRTRKRAANPNRARAFQRFHNSYTFLSRGRIPQVCSSNSGVSTLYFSRNVAETVQRLSQCLNWCADPSPCGICGGVFSIRFGETVYFPGVTAAGKHTQIRLLCCEGFDRFCGLSSKLKTTRHAFHSSRPYHCAEKCNCTFALLGT
jgi:hypothetical protein